MTTRAGLILIALLLAACGSGSKSTGSSASTGGTPADFDFGANSPTRATAFGDSITRGVVGNGAITQNNYPNILQSMLKGLDGTWRVVNRGVPGEEAQQGARRLPGTLAVDKPGFVLIMEGTNNAGADDDPSFIVAQLQSMVNTTKGNKSIPILATIPPDFRNDQVAQIIINNANEMIRTLARTQRIVLAEIFNGMNDRSLWGLTPESDPLHPNERGYSVMAGIWFGAMREAIPPPSQVASAPPPSGSGDPVTQGQKARGRPRR
jgi:lysophospholipase L1-like esterase